MRKLDAVIQVRITSSMKTALYQEAERRHIRPADVVRWALSQVITPGAEHETKHCVQEDLGWEQGKFKKQEDRITHKKGVS